MNQNHEPISDAQLDRYLDGLMDPVECQLLQQRLAGQPEIAQKIILQEKLDDTLRRQLAPPTVRAEDMREFIFRHAMPHAPVSLMASFNAGRLAWPLIAVGAVAAAVWIAVVWRPTPSATMNLFSNHNRSPRSTGMFSSRGSSRTTTAGRRLDFRLPFRGVWANRYGWLHCHQAVGCLGCRTQADSVATPPPYSAVWMASQ